MSKDPKTKLTEMQRRFCYEYIKDKNGGKAAMRAGYAQECYKKGSKSSAASQAAYKLFKLPAVRAFVRQLIAEQEVRLKFDADQVLNEIKAIACFDGSILMRLVSGELCVDDLTREERVAIAEYSVADTEHGKSIKLKSHPKLKALQMLAHHFNLLKGVDDDEDENYDRPDSMKDE